MAELSQERVARLLYHAPEPFVEAVQNITRDSRRVARDVAEFVDYELTADDLADSTLYKIETEDIDLGAPDWVSNAEPAEPGENVRHYVPDGVTCVLDYDPEADTYRFAADINEGIPDEEHELARTTAAMWTSRAVGCVEEIMEMSELSPRQFEVAVLRVEHTEKEIADILGIHYGTVRSHAGRAKESQQGFKYYIRHTLSKHLVREWIINPSEWGEPKLPEYPSRESVVEYALDKISKAQFKHLDDDGDTGESESNAGDSDENTRLELV